MLVPNRYSDDDYRYGFNGMEKDDEIKGGDGSSYDFGARMYDPRVGRWFANDPSAHLQPSASPYSFVNNNPIVLVDPDGKLPILPLLLKAGAAGGADMMMQVAMSYYFDDDVKSIGQAFDKVDYVQVARSAAEGLIPWKVPGGKLGKAGATALGDVLVNAASAGLAGKDYSKAQAVQDFTAGFLSDLAGGEIADLVKKYGGNKVRQVFKKLGLPDPCGCFTAGTQIYTDQGYKNIEDVQVGNLVWAFNEQTAKQELKKVINTFTKVRDHIYKIHFGDNVIEATEDHPFFINGQWLKVKNLKVGDLLTLFSGKKFSIDKIELFRGEYEVFNFEVEDDHTYYVSLGNVLVHNSGPCDWKVKNNIYQKNGYNYKTNSNGLISEASGSLRVERGRKWHNKESYDKLEGDHAGHLIGDVFGGSGSLANIVSMSKDVNIKQFAELERTWLGHLDAGKNVDVKIKVNYGPNKRPTSFDISYKVDGGETIKKHIKN